MPADKIAVLSGGGTAGHINPALALAEVLADRGWTVLFAGTPGGVEARLVPAAGLPFKGFEASGFRRSHPLTIITGVRKIQKSTKLARKWFDEVHPSVVVGFGGYVSIPVARAAEQTGVPVVVHEQNSKMGLANAYLAKRAQAVCETYDGSAKKAGVDHDRVHLTGNPVRKSVIEADRASGREYLGVPQDARMLLVFGGSLGARHINDAVAAMKDELLSRDDLYVVHVTGPKELDRVQEVLALTPEESERYIVKGYEDRMADALAAADATVSRAGATSLAEISARRVPALLVPFPFAAEDHQTTNAKEYVEAGAALLIPDDELDSEKFKELLLRLVDDPDTRSAQTKAAANFKTEHAAESLADVVESCI